jgi:hypothetical protein
VGWTVGVATAGVGVIVVDVGVVVKKVGVRALTPLKLTEAGWNLKLLFRVGVRKPPFCRAAAAAPTVGNNAGVNA